MDIEEKKRVAEVLGDELFMELSKYVDATREEAPTLVSNIPFTREEMYEYSQKLAYGWVDSLSVLKADKSIFAAVLKVQFRLLFNHAAKTVPLHLFLTIILDMFAERMSSHACETMLTHMYAKIVELRSKNTQENEAPTWGVLNPFINGLKQKSKVLS